MARNNRRPRPKYDYQTRLKVLSLLCGVFCFLVLFWKLWDLQIVQHDALEQQAVSQQTRKTSSTASRGAIYDTNGTVLAISGAVRNVILSPRDIVADIQVDEADEFGNPRSPVVIEAEKQQQVQEIYNNIADTLSEILEVDRAEIYARLQKTNSAWEPVANKVEDEAADRVQAFIDENDYSRYVYMADDAKRYYPYNNLAAQIVGFVNGQNQGAYGLEALYNGELSGTNGSTITAKNASGREMFSNFASSTDLVNGYDLHLTIDSTIQMYAENIVKEGISKFRCTNGGFCIVMEPKTGAVLAMVSCPDYDLNNPSAIIDSHLINTLTKMKQDRTISEEEYETALSEAQFSQWRNKALNDTYEPGSTFKPMVMAAALEEGVVTEDDSFTCTGAVFIDGWKIRCSARSGHGTQTLRRALVNSCNPALIAIGQKLTAEKFYEYWENYGFTTPTGIELPGEGESFFWNRDAFIDSTGIVNLAVASFGQRFNVTPLQLVRAISCVVNGGHLMEPYLVQSVTDADGNVVSYHEPTEVRQVISEQTSELMRSMMESVVNTPNGTGKNAYVSGYRIGGKTGTSQTNNEDHLIASFVGVAPANDPEIVVLIAFDWPQLAEHGGQKTIDGIFVSGGTMAAPMAGRLIANILDYLGYEKSRISADYSGVTVPQLIGSNLIDAQNALLSVGLYCRLSGEGDIVTDQAPAAGSSIPPGSTIKLYMGTERTQDTAEMPDLSNMTYSQAVSTMEAAGLYLEATGLTDGTVFSQDVAPGTLLTGGSVVEVTFADGNIQDEDTHILDEVPEGRR